MGNGADNEYTTLIRTEADNTGLQQATSATERLTEAQLAANAAMTSTSSEREAAALRTLTASEEQAAAATVSLTKAITQRNAALATSPGDSGGVGRRSVDLRDRVALSDADRKEFESYNRGRLEMERLLASGRQSSETYRAKAAAGVEKFDAAEVERRTVVLAEQQKVYNQLADAAVASARAQSGMGTAAASASTGMSGLSGSTRGLLSGVRRLSTQMPMLGNIFRTVLTPLVGLIFLVTEAFAATKKQIDEIGSRGTPVFQSLTHAVKEQADAVDELKEKLATFQRSQQRMRDTPDTPKEQLAEKLAQIGQHKAGELELLQKAQAREEEINRATEESGLETHREFVLKKLQIDESYARRRLLIENAAEREAMQARTKAADDTAQLAKELAARIPAQRAAAEKAEARRILKTDADANDRKNLEATKAEVDKLTARIAELEPEVRALNKAKIPDWAPSPLTLANSGVVRLNLKFAKEDLERESLVEDSLSRKIRQNTGQHFGVEDDAKSRREDLDDTLKRLGEAEKQMEEFRRKLPDEKAKADYDRKLREYGYGFDQSTGRVRTAGEIGADSIKKRKEDDDEQLRLAGVKGRDVPRPPDGKLPAGVVRTPDGVTLDPKLIPKDPHSKDTADSTKATSDSLAKLLYHATEARSIYTHDTHVEEILKEVIDMMRGNSGHAKAAGPAASGPVLARSVAAAPVAEPVAQPAAPKPAATARPAAAKPLTPVEIEQRGGRTVQEQAWQAEYDRSIAAGQNLLGADAPADLRKRLDDAIAKKKEDARQKGFSDHRQAMDQDVQNDDAKAGAKARAEQEEKRKRDERQAHEDARQRRAADAERDEQKFGHRDRTSEAPPGETEEQKQQRLARQHGYLNRIAGTTDPAVQPTAPAPSGPQPFPASERGRHMSDGATQLHFDNKAVGDSTDAVARSLSEYNTKIVGGLGRLAGVLKVYTDQVDRKLADIAAQILDAKNRP